MSKNENGDTQYFMLDLKYDILTLFKTAILLYGYSLNELDKQILICDRFNLGR
jgi:hypothetical protein